MIGKLAPIRMDFHGFFRRYSESSRIGLLPVRAVHHTARTVASGLSRANIDSHEQQTTKQSLIESLLPPPLTAQQPPQILLKSNKRIKQETEKSSLT